MYQCLSNYMRNIYYIQKWILLLLGDGVFFCIYMLCAQFCFCFLIHNANYLSVHIYTIYLYVVFKLCNLVLLIRLFASSLHENKIVILVQLN